MCLLMIDWYGLYMGCWVGVWILFVCLDDGVMGIVFCWVEYGCMFVMLLVDFVLCCV